MEKADTKAGDVEAQQGNGQASDSVAYRKQSDQISEANPTWSMSPDNNFRFDFTLPEADPEATGALLEAVPGAGGAEQIQTSVRATEQENWSGALHSVDSGHESKFAFNFAIPDEADEDWPPEPLVSASQHTEGMADHEVLGNTLPAESAEVLQVTALQKPELAQTAGSPPKEDKSHPTLKIPKPETAPGDKTVMEKSASDGAAQKKKKKKKQKPSVSKKETEETEVIRKTKTEANGYQNKNASHQDETFQQSDDQLWKEVDWCAEQLELGLKTQKSTPKQAEEALRAIKTLRNDKAPLVKKRQVMRTLFGDYRKKMEEERCKQLKLMQAAAKSARIVEVEESIRNKNCQVVRKRFGVCRKKQDSAGSPSESPGTLNTVHPQALAPACPTTTMEEVWVVYLCLILLIVVLLLMKHNPHLEEAKKERESKSPPPSSSFLPSNVGKQLEHTQEELEHYLERLTHVLFDSEARKRDGHHDQKSHHHQHRSADARSEPKEHSGKEAVHSQYLSSHTRVQEKTTPPGSTENIVEEIEQAVQETVDTDLYMRRRQRPTASRRYREGYRPETAIQPETDST